MAPSQYGPPITSNSKKNTSDTDRTEKEIAGELITRFAIVHPRLELSILIQCLQRFPDPIDEGFAVVAAVRSPVASDDPLHCSESPVSFEA